MSEPEWEPDILGAGYVRAVLPLGDDPDGEGAVEAVLVRREPRPGEDARGVVLYVHGFTDYFFQTRLADFLAARGLPFYALDNDDSGPPGSLLPSIYYAPLSIELRVTF